MSATITKSVDDLVASVPAFGIEINHPRNADVLLQCIEGCRLRSAIDGVKPIINTNKESDETFVPVDQIRHLSTFPKTPGMQVHVNPAELTYMIVDPLHGNVDLCARVQKWIASNSAYSVGDKLNGAPPRHGEMDRHQMKSLCRELFWLVEAKEAERCKGPMPSMLDIEELDGNFLLNPGARIPTGQPRFEKDFASWAENVSRSGV